MREEGYYWVKWNGEWVISYYTKPCYEGDYTWSIGYDGFLDEELEIDERRIVRGE